MAPSNQRGLVETPDGNTAANPESDPLIGTVLHGRYQLDECIASGSMGRIYRAQHLALEKTVAIKILREELTQNETVVARFHREARAAARLEHPNSISVEDFGAADDGRLYLAMEWIGGRDLRSALAEDGPFAPERAFSMARQVCRALEAAHAKKVIHRDLKPANIMLTPTDDGEHVTVLDFGIAKIESDGADQFQTMAGVVCGTPDYLSPEQAAGARADGRSDLYSLGVVLFELLTGRKLFTGSNAMQVAMCHVRDVAPRVDHLNPALDSDIGDLIERMLSKAPEDRPQTGKETLACLAALQKSVDSSPGPEAPPPAPEAPPSRPAQNRPSRWMWVALAMGMLAVVGWLIA